MIVAYIYYLDNNTSKRTRLCASLIVSLYFIPVVDSCTVEVLLHIPSHALQTVIPQTCNRLYRLRCRGSCCRAPVFGNHVFVDLTQEIFIRVT